MRVWVLNRPQPRQAAETLCLSLDNRNTEEMNYSKEKDELLKKFIKCPDVNWDIPMIMQNILKNLSYEEIYHILLDLKNFKEPVANFTEHHVSISGYTKTFIEKGGFTKLLEIENIKIKKIEHKENAELENLETSTNLNKFLLKTKWLPHTVSLISLFFSIYVYFDAKTDSKKLEQKIEALEKKLK